MTTEQILIMLATAVLSFFSGRAQSMANKHDAAVARFRIRETGGEPLAGLALLEAVCRGRGWLLPGGVCDTDRGAAVVLDEFRAGKLGRVTLQRAPKAGDGA